MYFKFSQMFIIHSSSRVYAFGFALLVKEKEQQKMDVCGCKKERDGLGGQRTSKEGVMCRATHWSAFLEGSLWHTAHDPQTFISSMAQDGSMASLRTVPISITAWM